MPRRHVRMTIEYDGSGFAGFQVQDRARTVQGELEQALSVLGGAPGRVCGAGRTDAGVHAFGQVIAFDYAGRLNENELTGAFNGLLPRDLSVTETAFVAADFDPRRNASARSYRYQILNRVARSPMHKACAWHVPPHLRTELMNAAAAEFIGTHDFSQFASEPGPIIRHVFDCYCHRRNEFVVIDIKASAFARRMVRRIVGSLVQVGTARWARSDVAEMIDSDCVSALVAPSAPAHGLSLRSVEYGSRIAHRGRQERTVAEDA